MKLQFLLISLFAFVTSVAAAADNFAILTLLNKGYELPSGETCTTEEWDIITSTIYEAAYGIKRRNLRRNRKLNSVYFCTKYCAGFPDDRWCQFVYPSCYGVSYRRDLQENQEGKINNENVDYKDEERELTISSTDCLSKVNKIKNDLHYLKKSFSTDCQQVLSSSQDFICSEVNVITGWNLWNGNDNTIIMENFEDGGSLCRSTKVNIEAVVNDEDRQTFINKVKFDVTGPNGYQHTRTEFNGKYMMYGNSATNIFGQSLTSLGVYTVVATPNDDSNLSRTLTFTVNDC